MDYHIDEDLLDDAGAWMSSFLERKLTSADIAREELNGIALGIGFSIGIMRFMGREDDHFIKSLGINLGEAERKYENALKFYKINDTFD